MPKGLRETRETGDIRVFEDIPVVQAPAVLLVIQAALDQVEVL